MLHLIYPPNREMLGMVRREPIVSTVLLSLRQHHLPSYRHSVRVAILVADIAYEQGIADEDLCLVVRAALIHDVGKTTVPLAILSAPRRLEDEERKTMCGHAQRTVDDLKRMGMEDRRVLYIAGAHHEFQPDPYPRSRIRKYSIAERDRRSNNSFLTGLAEIVALADKCDALTSKREYKPAFSPIEIEGALYKGFTGDHQLIPLVMKRVA